MKIYFILAMLAFSTLLLAQAYPRTRMLRGYDSSVAGYTQLSISDSSDSNLNDAFNHGTKALVQTIIAQQKAPLAEYKVTNWVYAYSKNTNRGVSYKFHVQLASARGVNIDMYLTVNYNSARNENVLGGYSFTTGNIPRGAFPGNGYKNLPPGQVTGNGNLQGALKYGAVTILQQLVNANKIPGADVAYRMTGLSEAVYKAQNNGVSYRFQTRCVNNAGVKANLNYTVFYNPSAKSYSIKASSYNADYRSKTGNSGQAVTVDISPVFDKLKSENLVDSPDTEATAADNEVEAAYEEVEGIVDDGTPVSDDPTVGAEQGTESAGSDEETAGVLLEDASDPTDDEDVSYEASYQNEAEVDADATQGVTGYVTDEYSDEDVEGYSDLPTYDGTIAGNPEGDTAEPSGEPSAASSAANSDQPNDETSAVPSVANSDQPSDEPTNATPEAGAETPTAEPSSSGQDDEPSNGDGDGDGDV